MPWCKPYSPPNNQRLDASLYATANQPCFITICAYADRAPFVNAAINSMIVDTLRELQASLRCRVHVYCLMPDHLHFVVSPDEEGASVLTYTDRFKGKTTNLSWRLGWRGKLWQPRYYDHIVRREESLLAISQYIVDNPVRKGLVDMADDWPWSGIMSPPPL